GHRSFRTTARAGRGASFYPAKKSRAEAGHAHLANTSDLQRIIEATPSGALAFLVTEFGRPFTANGFGNRFRKWCDEVGLPCSAHGLRKTAATRLAEAGASELEIRAITGLRHHAK